MDSSLEDMVRIEGGTYAMGSNDHYPEEKPAHNTSHVGVRCIVRERKGD